MAASRINASQPVPPIQPQSNGTGPASSSGVRQQAVADAVGQFAGGINAREAAPPEGQQPQAPATQTSSGYSTPVFKLPQIGTDLAASGGFEEPFGGKPEKTEEELKEEEEKGGKSLF